MRLQGFTPRGLRIREIEQLHIAGHQVRHQLIVQRQHHRFLHLRMFLQARFDFSQFNAQPANFHLMVDTPAVFDGAVCAVTR